MSKRTINNGQYQYTPTYLLSRIITFTPSPIFCILMKRCSRILPYEVMSRLKHNPIYTN